METPRCPRCSSVLPREGRLGEHCASCLLSTILSTPPVEDDVSEPWIQLPGLALFEELGRGGGGVVYRGRQVSLGRDVAVKVLRWGSVGPSESAERFRREARAAGRLQHPSIVRILDTGIEQDLLWISMDLIDGPTLETLRRARPYSSAEAVQLVVQLCDAMEHAHAEGVLHRDLKPSNVLVDRQGVPHITDFGLASLLEPDLARGDSNDQLTRTGHFLGSPGYAAPELSLQGESSQATDVYGLGAILYFLLSGEPPVQGKTLAALLAQQREYEPLPLRHFLPRLARDLERVCQKCLHRDPADRYPSARALGEDLRRHLQGMPVLARPPSIWRQTRALVRRHPVGFSVASLSVVFALALTGVAIAWQNEQRAQEHRANLIQDAALARRTQQAGQQRALLAQLQTAWKIAPGSDVQEEVIAQLSLPEITREPSPADSSVVPFEVPPGRVLAQLSPDQREIELRDRATGDLLARCVHPLPVTSFDVSGDLVAAACENRFIYIWDTQGNLRHRLSGHQGIRIRVRFRPFRQELVSVAADDLLWVWHAGRGTPLLRLQSQLLDCERLVWTDSDERLVAWRKDGGEAFRFHWPRFFDVLSPPGPEPHTENLGSAALHPSGELATACDENQLRVWDFKTGTTLMRVPKTPGQWLSARFNPQGDRLYFCGWDLSLSTTALQSEGNVWHLGKLTPLRDDFGALVRDHTRDGTQFLLSQDGAERCLVVDVEGREKASIPQRGPLAVALAPDGTWCATSSFLEPGLRIWALPSAARVVTLCDGLEVRQLLNLPGDRLLADTSVGPQLFSTRTWTPLAMAPPDLPIGSMTVSGDGKYFAALAHEAIQVRSAVDFSPLLTLPVPTFAGWVGEGHLVFASQGSRLLLHTASGAVLRWDLDRLQTELSAAGVLK